MIIVPAVTGPVRAARQAAERARCMAYGLLASGDRLRLIQHAQELERQAVALEQEAARGDTSTPPVTPLRTK